MSKIRVVHLVTRLDFGGAQQNTLYTVSHLDPERFDVSLWAGEGGLLDADAKALSRDARRPFSLQWIRGLSREIRPVGDLSALIRIYRLLGRSKPEVLHTHSSKAGILGRLAAWFAGVPVVVHTYHGFGFHERQFFPVRLFYACLEWLCCRMSSRIVFVSEANRAYARRWRLARPGQETLIRSGIRLCDYPARVADRAQKKASLGCGSGDRLIVSVGNLKPQKNPEGFVRIAQRCLKKVPDSRWIFIGDGTLRRSVEALVEACALSRSVAFVGWRRDVAEILACADVFVLASFWEGLPRALVEAMKTGLPCACYATDGVKDLLRDAENGLIVPVGDEEAMAASVAKLLTDPAWAQRLGARASQSVDPSFDIDFMVRGQESMYADLAR